MVAYHFPPLAGSSGIQRTLRFAQNLPEYGWNPLVLSATPRAYERTGSDLNAEVRDNLVVRRAHAFDTARHFSFRGRYPGFLARPDRWMTWQFDGLRVGLQMVREYKPDVLWTTYPIATAHLIGARLSARTGLPWVADFRDPMVQDDYPEDPKVRASFEKIERAVLLRADRCVFATQAAAREYAERYPACAGRIQVLENGYDEESFAGAERSAMGLGPLSAGRTTLLHSGIVYPSERDPTQLMAALARLKKTGMIATSTLRVRFRAAVHEALLRELAEKYGVSDLIEVEPPIDYGKALVEMMRADALLVLQAANCNMQVPAKVYEYLRARRPLLVLSDPEGETVRVLQAAGVMRHARLDGEEEIAGLLASFLADPLRNNAFLPDECAIRGASREARTRELASVLDRVARGAA